MNRTFEYFHPGGLVMKAHGKALIFAVLMSSFAVAGCGKDVVCIQWGENEGACPSREDARDFMAPPCDEPITSIDSDGEYDEGACCYEVTKEKLDYCEVF